MEPSCLSDLDGLIVADTSTAINLNATGISRQILGVLPSPLVILDIVIGELELGRNNGRCDADLVAELTATGLVKIAKLDAAGRSRFEELVIGDGPSTLDDGEAATIAYGLQEGGTVLVDERKAMRICAEQFPQLRVGYTTDLFSHPTLATALGRDVIAEAVFNALRNGRMRVPSHHIPWVVDLIGPERALQCKSLPKFVRTASAENDSAAG